MLKRFTIFLALQWLFLGTEIYVAHVDHFLTQAEVVKYHGAFGLSLLGHIATRLDILLISPLMALTVSLYLPSWSDNKIALSALFAFAISLYMHFVVYAGDSDEKPTAIFHDGYLTEAGMSHMVFMSLVLTCCLLFYFASKPSIGYARFFSTALAVHVTLATIQPAWHLGLVEAFNSTAISITIFAWIILIAAQLVLLYRITPKRQ